MTNANGNGKKMWVGTLQAVAAVLIFLLGVAFQAGLFRAGQDATAADVKDLQTRTEKVETKVEDFVDDLAILNATVSRIEGVQNQRYEEEQRQFREIRRLLEKLQEKSEKSSD